MRIDGGLHAQTIRLEDDSGGCAVSIRGIIDRGAGVERVGLGVERRVAGGLTGLDAWFAGRRLAVIAGELARLPRTAIDLATLTR